MPWVAFSARLGVDLLMSAAVPGSTFISLTSITSDPVYDTPKADLIVPNQQKLMRMGASEALAGALLKNRWYSLTVLTTLVTELERLAGVKGRSEIISLAATAANEEKEARSLAASVQLLARLNVTEVPLRALVARRTVVGVTSNGALGLPRPGGLPLVDGADGPHRGAKGPPGASPRHLAGRADVAARPIRLDRSPLDHP